MDTTFLRILETNGRRYEVARASPPREGAVLLQGRAVCGRCGRHFRVRYAAWRGRLEAWYVCDRAHSTRGEPNCHRRYLDALAVVDDPSEARHDLRGLARPVRRNGRSYRGFNPAAAEDTRLFAAIMRGEHAINGFRNRDIRGQLFKPIQDTQQRTRRRARVGRLLKRLHIHGLIAKTPRTRRWRVTSAGQRLMTTLLILHHEHYPKLLTPQAA